MHAAPDHQTATAKANAAVLVFIFCCLLSTARLAFEAPRPANIQRDNIASRSDDRFATLKSSLPATGVVGYIGEPGDSATPDYYLTQYALAPLVIDFSPNHTMVIGNFPSSPPTHIPKDLQLVKDFGRGVMLFSSQDVNRKDAN